MSKSLLEVFGLTNLEEQGTSETDTSLLPFIDREFRDKKDLQKFYVSKSSDKYPVHKISMVSKYWNPDSTIWELGDDRKAYLAKMDGSFPSHSISPFVSERVRPPQNRFVARKRKNESSIPPHSKKLKQSLGSICRKLLDKRWEGFRENPFSPKLTLPYLESIGMGDYYQRIDDPISLMDVDEKIKSDEYQNIDEMDRDIKLIWRNAQDYHGVGNRFAQMAEELYNYFQDLRRGYDDFSYT